jgi:4-amino-4-deoxy-L-arabinose transferase-like glycosyltransferase
MEKIALNLINWIKKNPLEFGILLAILIIAAFCRLYKISDYMTFLGDEGRDVIIVRRFLTEFHPPLIGAGTSIGNMYLGPLYYYMMAPALLIANFSPVGPAVQIAILGVITVLFIWFVGRGWFGRIAGLIAAGLFAISPTVIIFSRSSWNPNIMPFFALLSIFSIWKVWKEKKYRWMVVLGISFAFVLQSHYLGLFLAPTLFLFWIWTLVDIWKDKIARSSFVRHSLLAVSLFALLMSPLLIFDLRHNFQNLTAIKIFFTSSKDIGLPFYFYLSKIGSITSMILSNLISAKNVYLNTITLILFLSALVWMCINKKFKGPFGLIFLWLFVGIVGVSLYKGSVYDHYLEFLFPAPFLLLGAFAQNLVKNKFWYLVFGIYLSFVMFVNLKNSPILSSPNMQLPRAIAVAKIIQEKANGERFNLASISNLNNRNVYQYFLMVWGEDVVDTNPSSTAFTITDQLFVVCEFPREVCDPVNNPSAWITNFGWTKIVDEWPVWGGTLFKLGHNK